MRARFATLLALVLLPAAAQAETRTYCGALVSGGHKVTAETDINTNADGSMTGTYSFVDKSHVSNGTLAPAKPLGHNTFRFIWTDEFGSGQLELRFNADSSAFAGKWGDGSSKPRLMWNGKSGESCLNIPST